MIQLLRSLSEAAGVSGREGDVSTVILSLISDHVDEIRVDALGNLIAHKNGTGQYDMLILADAHMDEVGMMVSDIDRDGSIRFMAVGGIDSRSLLGKVVQIGESRITGVVGLKPVHILSKSETSRLVPIEKMRIDIGSRSKNAALKKVKIGEPIIFNPNFQVQGDIAFGKAFDNRSGCAILVELLRREPFPFDLTAVFSVQEEIGLRGASAAAFPGDVDAAIVIETTPAYDMPNKRDVSPNVRLGGGPAIYIMDRDAIQDPSLVAHIMKTARDKGISYQIRQPGGGGTNTGKYQRTGKPIPAATIASPARYIHGPVSMISLIDFQSTLELADSVLRSLRPETVSRALN